MNDPEPRNGRYFALFTFGASYVKVVKVMDQYRLRQKRLLTVLLALNVDLNLNCLHLLTPVQRHRSAPIRVLCDPVRYINLLVVVVVVVGQKI